MSQLALPLKLQDHAVFESFYARGNEALLAELHNLAEHEQGPGCYIWGAPATGKTHLLQAVCALVGDSAVYLPLSEFVDAGPAVLDGLAARRFVCLDDLQCIVGVGDWELALFALLNQLLDVDGKLIVSAAATPRDSDIGLADLESRLSRLPVYHTRQLDDESRISALQLRAGHRGLDLPDETARFLLLRSRRDMNSLYQLLDRLDSESLVAKRRLTVPFVSEVLQRL